MNTTRILTTTAALIAIAQFGLGLGYLLAPAAFNGLLGLTAAPAWTAWPFAMLGARFLAFGFGMLLVVRDPWANRGWIQAMIAVQALDWIGTMVYVLAGTVTLSQVATASFLPVLFVVGLAAGYPRADRRTQPSNVAHEGWHA